MSNKVLTFSYIIAFKYIYIYIYLYITLSFIQLIKIQLSNFDYVLVRAILKIVQKYNCRKIFGFLNFLVFVLFFGAYFEAVHLNHNIYILSAFCVCACVCISEGGVCVCCCGVRRL